MKLPIYKKLTLLFLIFNSLTMIARAQVQFGIKGGMNISEIMTSGKPVTNIDGGSQDLRYFPFTTVHGGVFASIQFAKKWSLQPELLYSMQGATGKPEMNYFVTATEEDYRFSYLNIPILVKYKLPLGFFAETGPQIGILLNAKVNETLVGATSTIHYNVKDQLKSTDLSWALGAGYCSPFNVGLDIRYNLGLNNINQATAQGLASAPIPNGTMKSGVLQIGIFYLFGKKIFNPPASGE